MMASFQRLHRAGAVLLAVLGLALLGCDGRENGNRSGIPKTPSRQVEHQQGSQDQVQTDGRAALRISEAELDKAAAAYVAIEEINLELLQAVQQTEDLEERQRLQFEANQRMVLAAEKAGLDFGTYDNIMRRVRTDRALNDAFQDIADRLR